MQNVAIGRAQLVKSLYREIGLSLHDAASLVEAILEEIAAALIRGDAVKLSSFGTFPRQAENAAHRPQPENRQRGADCGPQSFGVPGQSYIEGPHQPARRLAGACRNCGSK
jgi:nucleoid DNA-binding protein